jgi:electron transfer flavoprotein beta subunit
MRIIVCVKQGVDPQSVKISRSREELDLREARMRTQPEDKYALEAALRLKEAENASLTASEVIAVVVGGKGAEDTAREAVAMGADKAVLILQDGMPTGRAVAALVQAAVDRLGGADLILTGRSGDLDAVGPLGGRLAAALDFPLFFDVLSFESGQGGLTAVGRTDSGAVRMPVSLPAVATVMAGTERPRYPHPSRIAVAWNEGYVETWQAADLGVAEELLAPDSDMGGLVLGPERQRGQMISGSPSQAATDLAGILAAKNLL